MRWIAAIVSTLIILSASAAAGAETSGAGAARAAYEARDYAQAFRLASDLEGTDKTGEALYILSRIYKESFGVTPRNEAKALDLLRRAADKGHPPALSTLGMVYFDGDGVEKNIETAKQWWHKAAAKNDDAAIYNLAHVFTFVDLNYGEAIVWLKRAADGGNVDALMNLARLHQQGLGTPRNMDEAAALTRRAAIAGNQGARQKMVEYFVNGTGVPQDIVRAQMWALIAERKGDGISPEGRSIVNARLTDQQKREAEQLAGQCIAHPETGC